MYPIPSVPRLVTKLVAASATITARTNGLAG